MNGESPKEAVQKEALLIEALLDQLPIHATKIGYRGEDHEAGESSVYDRQLGEALFKVAETWNAHKPKCLNPECPQFGNCRGECLENFVKESDEHRSV